MSETQANALRVLGAQATLQQLVVPLSIFLGAALLFALEPMIAKMILPWFGGAAQVWIVCLLFFQVALLGGYFYAHLLSTRLSALWQLRVHLSLLAVSLLFLPVIPNDRWKPVGFEEPLPLILGVLTSTVGLPFLLLASTGPLSQAWLSYARRPDNSQTIYRLYALSNVGSLLALLLYPVLVEPSMSTRAQAWSWSAAYCVFVISSAAVAWNFRNRIVHADCPPTAQEDRPSLGARMVWFLLAFAPSALLLAITNYLLRNVAAIPFFWVIPLALYLLSFIVTFDSPRWYYRPLWYALFAAGAGAMIYFVVGLFLAGNYVLQLAFYAIGMFVCCMVCHGELASMKPKADYLTTYYLIIASGGAMGGLLIAVIAPAIFKDDFDLALMLPVVALLVLIVAWRRVPSRWPPWLRWNALVCVLYGWIFVTGHMAHAIASDISGNMLSNRNFYGPLRVTIKPTTGLVGETIELRNGNVIHGREFAAANRRCEPLSYYAPPSGIGLTIREMGNAGPLNIGVIGLGAGTIAGYGRNGDRFRFYEINPLIQKIAMDSFHYLSCPGEHSIAMGDARLTLEREHPQGFDVLAVDAFTSDAIPVHLLTKEAFALYWRHLKPDGVLAVHVSNQYVDLAPIVAIAARDSGKTAKIVTTSENASNAIEGSEWVLVSSEKDFFSRSEFNSTKTIATETGATGWTDDYSNIWRVLK